MDKQVEQMLKRILTATITDGGAGSGNFGHAGRPGHLGGSAKGSGGSAFGGMRSALNDVKTKLKGVSGGTFDKNGNVVSHDNGFQVTFYRSSVNDIDEKLHDGLVEWMCNTYNTEPEFGVWTGDNGVTEAELSFRVEKQEDAEKLM